MKSNNRTRLRHVHAVFAVLLIIGLLCLIGGLAQAQDQGEAMPKPSQQSYSVYLPVVQAGDAVGPEPEFDPSQLIVQLKPELSSEDASVLASVYGAVILDVIPEVGGYVWQLPAGTDVTQLQGELQADPAIAFVEPDYYRHTTETTPNDPMLGGQWALTAIEARSAWDVTRGSPDVIVAVVDTGIDITHPDLANKLTPPETWFDFGNNDNDPTDVQGHGTHVAGIIAANVDNGTGIAGLSWNTRILPVKVFPDNSGSATASRVARGVIHATLQGARVINLSLGSTRLSKFEEDAINFAYDRGVVVVAAAGNDNTTERFYPAAAAHVISVASIQSDLVKSSFSNYGNWVDISAPGSSILSTIPGALYASWSGTSMATPYVSGLASLLLAQKPEWTPEQVEQRIRGTATNLDAANPSLVGQLGAGMINAFAAVEGNGPPTPQPPTPQPPTPQPPTPQPPTPEPPPPPARIVSAIIQRLQAKSNDACDAMDFKASMEIKHGASASKSFGVKEGNDIHPNWQIYSVTDAYVPSVDVYVKVRDDDDFVCGGGDDDVDVNPDARQQDVTLRVNLASNEIWLLEPDGETFQRIVGTAGNPFVLEGFEGAEEAIMTMQININTEVNLRAMHTGKCLDVDLNRGLDDGANGQQWDCYGPEQTNQVWMFRQVGSYFQVVSKYSGKCLDVDISQDGSSDGVNIQQWQCLGETQTNQLWFLFRSGDGYELVSAMTGKCADVAWSGTENGANVHQWTCNGGLNQRWYIGW